MLFNPFQMLVHVVMFKMKLTSVSLLVCCLILTVTVSFCHVLRETGCPEPEDIEPCKCYGGNSLECIDVNNVDDFRNVFINSARYTYRQVNISFSSLLFLPHEMFDQTVIKELILYNVSVIELFDSPPSGLDYVRKLHIENTLISRRMSWELLQNMTSLRILDVYYNTIKRIDESFSTYVTKDLEQLTFYATKTLMIKPGILTEFVKLDKLAVDACKLTTLTRDLFPRPFNARVLYFNDNKIASIPEDLFTDMPKLQTVGMRNNLIATIPESAFGTRYSSITYVMLQGNPLKCDCLLQWMVKEKPEVLRGTCASPKRLHGRDLGDLSPGDFNC